MDLARLDSAAGVSVRSFGDFLEATRTVLKVLEREIPDSALFVAHLDSGAGEMRIIDAAGEGGYGLAAGQALPLDASFCVHMAAGTSPQLVADASADPNYAASPLREELDIGSYAGVPIESEDGVRVGSLCAISHDRGRFTQRDVDLLAVMARLLTTELEREAQDRTARRITERLREIAITDPLTELTNRRGFETALDREWKLAAERGAIRSALALLDLDGLKQINDSQGHAAGDEALKRTAAALKSEARGPDIISRIGGDEFAAILVGCETLADAENWIGRVSSRLATNDGTATLALSYGLSALQEAGSPAEALEIADALLYERKRGNRKVPGGSA